MKRKQWVFPSIPGVTGTDQIEKIQEEAGELKAAWRTAVHVHPGAKSIAEMLEEYYDTIHATQQMGDLLEKLYGADRMDDAAERVEQKNRERGYYEHR